jgi:single-strand DNA-binding protein
MIQVQMTGYLGSDCKVVDMEGKKVINFSVASTEKYTSKQGTKMEKTTWLNCSYWSESKISDFLKEGTLIFLQGELDAYIYEKPASDIKLLHLGCRVTKIELLSSKKDPV